MWHFLCLTWFRFLVSIVHPLGVFHKQTIGFQSFCVFCHHDSDLTAVAEAADTTGFLIVFYIFAGITIWYFSQNWRDYAFSHISWNYKLHDHSCIVACIFSVSKVFKKNLERLYCGSVIAWDCTSVYDLYCIAFSAALGSLEDLPHIKYVQNLGLHVFLLVFLIVGTLSLVTAHTQYFLLWCLPSLTISIGREWTHLCGCIFWEYNRFGYVACVWVGCNNAVCDGMCSRVFLPLGRLW